MHNDFDSYIDSFTKITIIIRKNLCFKEKSFFLNFDDVSIPLVTNFIFEIDNNYKYEAFVTFELELNKEYIIVDEFDNVSYLQSGKVVRTKEFEDKYYCDKPLGVIYSKEGSIFRLWTPVAKEVILELKDNKNKETKHKLEYITKGLWELVLDGDYELFSYRYLVRLNVKFNTLSDPYAYSSSSNAKFNYIVDFEKFKKFKYEIPDFSGNICDSIIYEASIRDFTIDESSGTINKGKFLGFLENHPTKEGYSTGMSYLKYLGITHLQLMPIFDFGGVDDNNSNKYNWGYNPEQYFIPCGWYSVNPDKPYDRINEMRSLVDGASANGIRIVSDVVFNHVYDMKEFAFEKLVPGYFYSVDSEGIITNSSGCSNDLASNKKMCRKFIIDVIKHWISVYNIRGFRFDLMGLLDIETMIEIKETIKEYDSSIILYGEGWKMSNSLPDHERSHMFNYDKIPEYAFFNDYFRDYFRGSQFDKTLGYSFGMPKNEDLAYLIQGSCIDNFLFDEPTQTINYVECHDNYTFIDYANLVSELSECEKIDYSALAISIVLFSQGAPFISMGQEFLRSKQMVENSYNSGDVINAINFNNRDKYIEIVNMVRDIIKIRKKYSEFRFNTRSDIVLNIKEINNELSSSYYLINGNMYNLLLIVKNTYEDELIKISNFEFIFDGRKEVEYEIKRE